MYLDKICNLIGWRGMTTEDQGLPGTDPELVTSLLIYLARTQPEVRGHDICCLENIFRRMGNATNFKWVGVQIFGEAKN